MAVRRAQKATKPKRKAARGRAAQVIYLYGISAPAKAALKSPGVDGTAAVEALRMGAFTCWISRVDREEFGAELARRMENLDWLANASVRHQRVVGALAEKVTILPARFGTVFLTEQSLQSHVAGQKPTLAKRLKHLSGAEEWGVKVFRRARAAATVEASSGADYLRQKAAILKKDGPRELDADVVAFAKALQEIARDSAPAGKVSSGQSDLEWQASFLVPRSRRKQWDAVLKEYATRWGAHREIECTGPWPPYSFVS
jgi:hypothetical protein